VFVIINCIKKCTVGDLFSTSLIATLTASFFSREFALVCRQSLAQWGSDTDDGELTFHWAGLVCRYRQEPNRSKRW